MDWPHIVRRSCQEDAVSIRFLEAVLEKWDVYLHVDHRAERYIAGSQKCLGREEGFGK